jgi:tetratricopeptide (TPR) repeat protein
LLQAQSAFSVCLTETEDLSEFDEITRLAAALQRVLSRALANFYRRRGSYDFAMECFMSGWAQMKLVQTILETRWDIPSGTSFTPLNAAWALINIGDTFYLQNRHDDALESYQEAIG